MGGQRLLPRGCADSDNGGGCAESHRKLSSEGIFSGRNGESYRIGEREFGCFAGNTKSVWNHTGRPGGNDPAGVALSALLPVHVKIYAACDPSPDLRIRILGFLHFFQIRASYREGKSDWSAGAFWGKWVLAPKRQGRKSRMRADMAPEKVLKKRKRRHPGLRPERRGFPGNLKFPRMESRPELPKIAGRDTSGREAEERTQKSGQAEHAPAADERVRKKAGRTDRTKKSRKKRRQRGGSSAAERLRNLGSGLPDASQRRAISFLLREGLAYLKNSVPI